VNNKDLKVQIPFASGAAILSPCSLSSAELEVVEGRGGLPCLLQQIFCIDIVQYFFINYLNEVLLLNYVI
jgi:hypothetical protein